LGAGQIDRESTLGGKKEKTSYRRGVGGGFLNHSTQNLPVERVGKARKKKMKKAKA